MANADNPKNALTGLQYHRLCLLMNDNASSTPAKGQTVRIAAAEGVSERAIQRTYERVLKKLPSVRSIIYEKRAPRTGS